MADRKDNWLRTLSSKPIFERATVTVRRLTTGVEDLVKAVQEIQPKVLLQEEALEKLENDFELIRPMIPKRVERYGFYIAHNLNARGGYNYDTDDPSVLIRNDNLNRHGTHFLAKYPYSNAEVSQQVATGANWSFFEDGEDDNAIVLTYKPDKGYSVYEPKDPKKWFARDGYLSALQASTNIPNIPLPSTVRLKYGVIKDSRQQHSYLGETRGTVRQLVISHGEAIAPTRFTLVRTITPYEIIVLKVGFASPFGPAPADRRRRLMSVIKGGPAPGAVIPNPVMAVTSRINSGGRNYYFEVETRFLLGETNKGKTTLYFSDELASATPGAEKIVTDLNKPGLGKDWWIVQVEWRTDDIVEFWRDTYLNRRAPQPPSETT